MPSLSDGTLSGIIRQSKKTYERIQMIPKRVYIPILVVLFCLSLVIFLFEFIRVLPLYQNQTVPNDPVIDSVTAFIIQWGFIGALITGLLSTLSLFAPIFPFPAVIMFFGAVYADDPIALVVVLVVTAIGASFGESTGYILGRGGMIAFMTWIKKRRGIDLAKDDQLPSEDALARIGNPTLRSFVQKLDLDMGAGRAPFFIFWFALTPLPDDILWFFLGARYYSYLRCLFFGMIGKGLQYSLYLAVGTIFEDIRLFFDPLILIPMVVIFLITMFAAFKFDWTGDSIRAYLGKIKGGEIDQVPISND